MCNREKLEIVTKYLTSAKISFFMFILLVFAITLKAQGQEQEDLTSKAGQEGQKAEAAPVEKMQQGFDNSIMYMPMSKVKAQSGKVGIIESDIDYDYKFKLFDQLPITFGLEHQYIGINNSTAVKLPSHLFGLSADIETIFPFFNFKETYLGLGINPSFFSDDYLDFDSTVFRIPTRYFLIHRPNKKWTFITGVSVAPEFKYYALPILGFIYKPNDKLTFNIIPDRPSITYLLNDKTTLFLEGGFALDQEFKVTRGNLNGLVLRYEEINLGTGVTYRLNKYIKSSFSVGGVFNHSLQYKDTSLGKVRIKDGLYSEFRLEIEM